MIVRPRFVFAVAALVAGTLIFAASPAALAGAKKQSAVSIRFYAEGGEEGGNFAQKVELINPKRMTTMQSLALLSEREVKSFFPFPAQDGSGTWGASFRLDSHGSNLLAEHTMSRRGSYLLAYFNGRHVVDLYVDRGVNDGIVSIPTGLTPNDISLLEVSFPHMGHEDEKPGRKQRSAKPTPTPLPKAADMPRMQPAMNRQADGTLAPARAYPGGPASDGGAVAPAQPRPLSPIGQ